MGERKQGTKTPCLWPLNIAATSALWQIIGLPDTPWPIKRLDDPLA